MLNRNFFYLDEILKNVDKHQGLILSPPNPCGHIKLQLVAPLKLKEC